MHRVGPKGQVVIEKSLRERLGVARGWQTIQRLVDDHVEIYFVQPKHDRSLFGFLASYAVPEKLPKTWDELQDLEERAVEESVAADFGSKGS